MLSGKRLKILIILALFAVFLRAEDKPGCPKPCTNILDLQCGTDGNGNYKYFSSSCRMEAFNLCDAKEGQQYQTTFLEECTDISYEY